MVEGNLKVLEDGSVEDPSTGLVWLPPVKDKMTYSQAIKYCKSKDFRLPTVKEFKDAAVNGVTKINPETWGQKLYWAMAPKIKIYNYAPRFRADWAHADTYFKIILGPTRFVKPKGEK